MVDPQLVKVRDQAVQAAQSVPELVDAFRAIDPEMAANVSGAASKAGMTPVGTLIAGAVGFAVSRWGLGWDANTQAMVTGAFVLGGGYVAHWVKIWLAQKGMAKGVAA